MVEHVVEDADKEAVYNDMSPQEQIEYDKYQEKVRLKKAEAARKKKEAADAAEAAKMAKMNAAKDKLNALRAKDEHERKKKLDAEEAKRAAARRKQQADMAAENGAAAEAHDEQAREERRRQEEAAARKKAKADAAAEAKAAKNGGYGSNQLSPQKELSAAQKKKMAKGRLQGFFPLESIETFSYRSFGGGGEGTIGMRPPPRKVQNHHTLHSNQTIAPEPRLPAYFFPATATLPRGCLPPVQAIGAFSWMSEPVMPNAGQCMNNIARLLGPPIAAGTPSQGGSQGGSRGAQGGSRGGPGLRSSSTPGHRTPGAHTLPRTGWMNQMDFNNDGKIDSGEWNRFHLGTPSTRRSQSVDNQNLFQRGRSDLFGPN